MPEVYALAANYACQPSDPIPQALTTALSGWLRNRYGDELPQFDSDAGWVRRTKDGGIVRWEVFRRTTGDGAALYELTWRHPHHFDRSPYLPASSQPEVAWSTRVSCVVEKGSSVLTIRIANTGPSVDKPNVLRTTRPRFLLDLARQGTFTSAGEVVAPVARTVSGPEVADLVRFVLFDPQRRRPVLVISPRADGTFVAPPRRIAEEVFTLASVYVIATPADTFALTHALGRRELSAFHGALRVYLPGLRADSNPLDHPLLIGARATESAARSRLAAFLALHTPARFIDDPRVHALRDERAAFEDSRLRAVEHALETSTRVAREAGDYKALAELYGHDNDKLREQLRLTTADMNEAVKTIARLEDDGRRLRYALAARASETEPADDVQPQLPQPESVAEAVDYAAELFGEQLLFLPSASSTAADHPYERPAEILGALQVLADVSRRRTQPGGLGRPLEAVFTELGLDYRAGITRNTSRRHAKQYDFRDAEGKVYFCPEHIAFGTSYDPRHCLRVYISTKAAEDRIVIGHVGRHLDVATTT